MIYLFTVLLMIANEPMLLYDFTKEDAARNWFIVDDVVMGGRSDGRFFVTEEGHGNFTGIVSTENNGGFSSVRYRTEPLSVTSFSKVTVRLKGDGKKYQFRIKRDRADRYSYVASFKTSGEWETIQIAFTEMIPTFRGYQLNMPNYPGDQLEEVAFLISNKVGEEFSLLIDWISVE